MHRNGACGSARLPLSARFAQSQRHTASPEVPFGCFCIVRTRNKQVAFPAVPTTGQSHRSDSWHVGQHVEQSCVLGEAEASGRSGVGLSGVLTVVGCEGLKLILNTWTPRSHCFLSYFTIFPHPCLQKGCVGHTRKCRRWCIGSIAGSALRSPNSGVKLPLLVSPLISYGNDAFRPCTCCPHIELHQHRRHCSLWSIFFPCSCSEHPSTSPKPFGFQQLQSTNLLRTFLNAAKWQLWQACLERVVIFTANFWMKMFL